jgi:putative ABC transport system substrate-binding protein
MRRREFVTLFGGAAATWPMALYSADLPVIGFLSPTSSSAFAPLLPAFQRRLAEAGYVEGQNVAIEYRWAEGHSDRLPQLAADLVAHRVAVITTVLATAAVVAAKSVTTTIPIVFAIGADPVKYDFVSNMARPNGNLTGVSFLSNPLAAKLLQLLNEVVPSAKRIGVLANPSNPNTKNDTDGVIGAARARC